MVINVTNDLCVAKFNGRFKVLLDLSRSTGQSWPFHVNWNTCLTWLPNDHTHLAFPPPHWLTPPCWFLLIAWHETGQHKLFYLLYSFGDLSWVRGFNSIYMPRIPKYTSPACTSRCTCIRSTSLGHLLLEVSELAYPKLSSWSPPPNPLLLCPHLS